MLFSKGKGLIAVLVLVVILTPALGNMQVPASDTNGLSGVAKVLAEATVKESSESVDFRRNTAGIAEVVNEEYKKPEKLSVRVAEKILRAPKIDIEKLEEQAKIKTWESKTIVTVDETEFVYVRSIPSVDGSVVGIMPHAAAGDVIEKKDGWSHIVSGSIEGYVSNDFLAFGREALNIAETKCGYVASVSSYEANVRENPSLTANVLSIAEEGQYFEVLSANSKWVTIKYSKDQVAYMAKSVVDVFLATGVAVHLDDGSSNKDSSSEAPHATEESPTKEKEDSNSKSKTNTASDTTQQASSGSISNVEESAPDNNNGVIFKVTAYCPCAICCGSADGTTASGTVCAAGRTIAVDPSIIPIGTTVYINGVPYVAEDTGVSGYKIDIFMNSHVEALNWGVRYCTITW